MQLPVAEKKPYFSCMLSVKIVHWLAQEKTIKLGQTDKDGTLYDVATITLYNDSYIGITICGLDGLDMTFAVSEDTANYLKGYFK